MYGREKRLEHRAERREAVRAFVLGVGFVAVIVMNSGTTHVALEFRLLPVMRSAQRCVCCGVG